jgi:hypothetical protein
VVFKNLTLQNALGVSGSAINATNVDLTLENCILRNNLSSMSGGALNMYQGQLKINLSKIYQNGLVSSGTFKQASAMFTSNLDLLVIQATEIYSHDGDINSTAYGVVQSVDDKSIVIRASSFYQNGDRNPALRIRGPKNDILVENSSFMWNSGYGMRVDCPVGDSCPIGGIKIVHSTFFENLSGTTGVNGRDISLSNGQAPPLPSLLIANTIFGYANQTGTSCPSIIGSYYNVTAANNLMMDNSCLLGDPNSIVAADLMLSPLGDYGGPTKTMVPGSLSPALNKGSAVYCLSSDQRGFLRATNLCDIGATEVP